MALLVAIFISNRSEAIGSASDMRSSGHSRRSVMTLWAAVTALCAGATVLGFRSPNWWGGDVNGAVDGFAAGALLVMLTDSMIPEAKEKAGDRGGLFTVLGFAVAAGLSNLT